MNNIFEYKSYKKYIQSLILSYGRGAVGKLAEAAGCNRTYLSQALNSKIHLTPDHVYGIADFVGLTNEEQDFLILLLLYERSASRKVREKLKVKIEEINQTNLLLSNKISEKKDSSEIPEALKAKYYSNWKYAAIHTLTSIVDFQSSSAIAKKVYLSEPAALILLKDLREMGLIKQVGARWIHSGKNIHTPVGSTHTAFNHLNWRLKSVEDVNDRGSIHYTTLFSLSVEDWDTLRKQLLSFIDKQRDQIHKSGAEDIYCFCCDLFQPLV
ncbi:MAG: TIGR02147 family protein [Bdellovibrionaceae bacterium]|nr:TIGR02147 family protein [Pseudobdellovibrionaceae bacterium]